jgi:hypothetical protein
MRALQPEVANVSPAVAKAIGRAIEVLPNPLLTSDLFLRMQSDCVLDELAPTKRLHDLGIEATSLEMPGHSWLHRWGRGRGGVIDPSLPCLPPSPSWPLIDPSLPCLPPSPSWPLF